MKVESIKGVGPKLATNLNKIGIFEVEDLLHYYPYRYNFINVINLGESDESIYVKAIIADYPRVFYIKKNFNRLTFKAMINNQEVNVTIFNRAFLKNNLTMNKEIILYGKYNSLKNTFTASDILFNYQNNTIEPVYHLAGELKQNTLIKLINEVLPHVRVVDNIPEYLNDKYEFISKDNAIKFIHSPNSIEEIKKAKLKLIYEELFMFMFKVNYLKKENTKALGIKRDFDETFLSNFINNLPFHLTHDQLVTINEIVDDLKSEIRMNRLVLGDVGSGKTIVAILAMYVNFLSGYQSAFMAPTEILANQHYINLIDIFKNDNINIELLTGKTSLKEKKRIYEELENGKIDILVGTHAMITDKVIYHNLGLVITDEQHRFGVNARDALQNKGISPDVLYLSATPIPRTYALTIYGDLSLSLIKTKPLGRKDIITKVIKENEIKDLLYKMLDELKKGHQIYVVSPLIETNEDLDLKSVLELKEKLSLAFKNIKIEILHGKLTNKEKDEIMDNFKKGEIKILISTTVIEVGIDVKNATMMVIYNAERFGLATLHQLRGRVGRNSVDSYCYLVSNHDKERLHVLEESNDGFYISEKDFELRGSGDLFGVRQSGDMVFKLADLKRDYKILVQATKDSEEFLNSNYYTNYETYNNIINDIKFIN